jgi:MauM/NapG family ferredoxin protein
VRKTAQVFFLLGWLVLWVSTAGLAWGAGAAKFPAEIDPLLALAQAIASRTLTAGMFLSLIVVVLTLVFGRVWCGWICPMGILLDFFPFHRIKKPHVPESLRSLKYLILTAILVAALFGNLSLLILDPVTIWVRTLTWGAGPALNTAFTAAENALGMIPWLSGPLTWLDGVMRPVLFPVQIVGSRLVWLPVLLFTLLILLNLISERFWCRYLCPLGGLLGLLSKTALFKRRVKTECVSCGKCETVCPTGTIDPKRGFASDAAECTICMDCLQVCPPNAIAFQPDLGLESKMPYDPGRRQVLITGLVTLAGLALIDTRSNKNTFGNHLLRPPGAKEDNLLQKCLRCGLCMRACPTGAIQSSLSESGLEGIFTPVLVPRLGYCLYSCNQCGQVCPVGAIPPLPLAEKQAAVIGHAFIDQNRCIPWADGITCIVCEEMCPLPEKAITLEDRNITRMDGSAGVLRLPHVIRERCIGCGICEYKCPRSGEAAIRVFRADI